MATVVEREPLKARSGSGEVAVAGTPVPSAGTVPASTRPAVSQRRVTRESSAALAARIAAPARQLLAATDTPRRSVLDEAMRAATRPLAVRAAWSATAMLKPAFNLVESPMVHMATRLQGDLMRLTPAIPRYVAFPVFDMFEWIPAWNGVTLATDAVRGMWQPLVESLTWQLDAWSAVWDLPGQLLLAEARRVRAHLISEQAADLGPVEEFAFEWLDYHRPARADERQALIEAVVEVLLGDTWDVEPGGAHHALRRGIDVLRRGTRPFWQRQIRGVRVESYDRLVPSPMGGDGVALIATLPGGHDVESDALEAFGGTDADPGVRFLHSVLADEEMAVVYRYADGQPGLTWSEAALLCGQSERMGETVRRKVRSRVKQYRQRQQDRNPVGRWARPST